MLTWLDWYASQSRKDAERFYRMMADQMSQREKELVREAMTDDGLSFRMFCMQARRDTLENLDFGSESANEMTRFRSIVAPFSVEHDSPQKELAATLSRNAVGCLRGMTPSSELREKAHQIVNQHEVVYLDLHDGAYPLGNTGMQIRSLFMTRRFMGRTPVVGFTAVLTFLGNNHGMRIHWVEGHWNTSPRGVDYDEIWSVETRDIEHPTLSIPRDVFADREGIFPELEAFALLTLAYVELEKSAEGPQLEQLGIVPAGNSRRNRQNAGQSSTLFAVAKLETVELDRPEFRGVARIEVPNTMGNQGPRVRHEVRGHYRLQPCGPGRSDRRLRWVQGHQRGSVEGVRRKPIRRLKQVDLDALQDAA